MNRTREGGGGRPALVALRWSLFFASWPILILYLLLPVYGIEIGASAVEIGLFFSAFSFMTVLMRPIVGWALDRFGRRPFFVIGLAGYAATWASYAFIDQVWGIIAARLLQGVSSSFVWLTAYAVVADLSGEGGRGYAFGSVTQASNQGAISSFFVPALSSLAAFAVLWALQALCYAAGDPAEQALVADLTGGDRRGRAYSFYAMAAGLGATAGPVGGAWLYQAVGPAAPFVANGIVLAVCAIVLAVWLRLPAAMPNTTEAVPLSNQPSEEG